MSRLPALPPDKVVRVLERAGFVFARQKGSHRIYLKVDEMKMVSIPFHPGDLKRGLLAGIIKDAGLTLEEFLSLL